MGFLRKFMYGRYGGDQLGRFTLALYLGLYLLALLTRWPLMEILSLVVAGLTLYRMLSRDIAKRRAENERFLARTAPVRGWWRRLHMKRTDKAHKYFKCPYCGQQLRVPRGSGKIRVTCRACGASFEQTS